MEKDLTAAARRAVAVLRIDLAIMRGELKAANNIARVSGTDLDLKMTTRALDHLDQAMRALDDPAIFHPTLF